MTLKVLNTFSFDNLYFAEYECDEVGDNIPLHDHPFSHLTKCTHGEIEVFTQDGRTLILKVGDKPAEYRPGTRHGIRGLTVGARFINISPQRH